MNSAGRKLSDKRDIFRKINIHIQGDDELRARYKLARKVAGLFAHSSFYEISHSCNLSCEGCYFFDNNNRINHDDTTSIDTYDAFFAAEKRRGILIGQFFGAEPSLRQERLLLATKYFSYGNLSTNGIIKIDDEVSMRIHISVWGDRRIDEKLRGKSVFASALANYNGDPRAIVAFTLTRYNLGGVREVVRLCKEHGIPITFNMFSPSVNFMKKVGRSDKHDNKHYRFSTFECNPSFVAADDLLRARETVDELLDEFPETVYYTHSYNHWITSPGPLYTINPAGNIAIDCGGLVSGNYFVFSNDTEQDKLAKCSHSNIDCRDCRVYGGGWSTRLMPRLSDVEDKASFIEWLDLIDVFSKIFIYQPFKVE